MKFIYQLASYPHLLRFARRVIPWLIGFTCISLGVGFYGGLWIAPPDYQQGEAFRLLYVHVPSAALSLGIYVVSALMSGAFYLWKLKITDLLAKHLVPIGAWFTFLALVTGALWGKPVWGTWWIWDARLTSELILLFLYLGLIVLRQALEDSPEPGKPCALLSLVGLINIPIIHYSVLWWNTLHQPPSLLAWQKPTIHPSMLWPLLLCFLGFISYTAWLVLVKVEKELSTSEISAS